MLTVTKKIILALLLLVLLPSVFIGYGTLKIFRQSLVESSMAKLDEIANKKVDQIRTYVDDNIANVNAIAFLPKTVEDFGRLASLFRSGGLDSPRFRELSDAITPGYRSYVDAAGYYNFFFITPSGDMIFTIRREKDFGSNLMTGTYRDTGLAEVVCKALTALEPDISVYSYYAPSGGPAAFVAAPLLENGILRGAVAMQVESHRFREVLLDNTGLGKTGETEVARREGDDALFLMPLLYDPGAAFKRRLSLTKRRDTPIAAALRGDHGSGFIRDYRNMEVLAAWRYIPSLRMGMVVKIDADEALMAADRMARIGWFMLAGIVGSVVMMGVFLGRSIIGPLRALQQATASIGRGHLDARVVIRGGDEFGQLSGSFNTMADRLSESASQLEQLVRERTDELEKTNHLLRDEIAERAEMEERLRETAAIQRSILDSSNYSIISTGVDGVIRSFNPAAERMLGFGAGELVGKQTPAVFHDHEEVTARAAVLSQELGRAIAPGFEVFVARARTGTADTNEWSYIRKDGSRFPVLLSVSALYGGHGEVNGFLGVAADISRLKAVESELVRARAEAEQANRYKSEFLASMSHEMRTPLNSIIGLSDVLLETPLDDEQRRLLRVARAAGDNLLYLINDILDLARIEAGQLTLENSPFNINEIVESGVEIISFRAREKGLKIVLKTDVSVTGDVTGDGPRLRQVFINLLGNAVKFSEKGTITLSVTRIPPDGDIYLFSLADEGIGIPREKQEEIFERFRQADSSVTRRYGGSGLGLTISKILVEMMGGKITVESEPGRGSRFTFSVRLCRAAPAVIGDALRRVRLLLVARDREEREQIGAMVRGEGATVSLADGEEAALDLLRKAAGEGAPFSLLLGRCDEVAESGCALGKKVRDLKGIPQPRILMIAGGAICGAGITGRDLGIRCGLVYPLRREVLVKDIRSALEAVQGEGTPSRPVNILLAEDFKDNRLLIKAFLKFVPHTMVMAENGTEAVAAFKNGRFDLVLMDVQMPEMDGYTATRAIREWEKEQGRSPTPIVALTAHAYREDRENSMAAGCTEHITKPISKGPFLELVARYTPSPVPML